MSRKLFTLAATALVALSGFVGAIINRAVAGHPRAQAVVHNFENEATRVVRSGFRCGIDRWSVKTLSDRESRLVDLTSQPRLIGDLERLTPPSNPTTRVAPVEYRTYKVPA